MVRSLLLTHRLDQMPRERVLVLLGPPTWFGGPGQDLLAEPPAGLKPANAAWLAYRVGWNDIDPAALILDFDAHGRARGWGIFSD
jgi:hypothetical protein